MHQISVILCADPSGAKLTDTYGNPVNQALELVIGTAVNITFDLRSHLFSPETAELLPLDPGVFSGCSSFFLAVDRDFKKSTAPLLLKTSGIRTVAGQDKTLLEVLIDNTAVPELLAALGDSKTSDFNCELAGLAANGTANFSWLFPVTLRNRLFMGGEVPESVTSDPAYLTSAEVKALVADEARNAAVEQLPQIGGNGNWFIDEYDTGWPAQGLQGETGPQGPQGIQGEVGPQGPQGIQGEAGPQGPQGERGAAGPQGETGSQGIQGDKGEKGEKGDKGDKGEKGDKGDKGDTGATGPQGETGPQGPQGEKGDKGDKGDAGSPLENNFIDVTAADGFLSLPDETIPVSVEINNSVYPVLGMTKEGNTFRIPTAPILAAANLAEYSGTWRVWRAGGKQGPSGGNLPIALVDALPENPDDSTLYFIPVV